VHKIPAFLIDRENLCFNYIIYSPENENFLQNENPIVFNKRKVAEKFNKKLNSRTPLKVILIIIRQMLPAESHLYHARLKEPS
jgi:hypothetical protein